MQYLATYVAKNNHDKATTIYLYFGSHKVVQIDTYMKKGLHSNDQSYCALFFHHESDTMFTLVYKFPLVRFGLCIRVKSI